MTGRQDSIDLLDAKRPLSDADYALMDFYEFGAVVSRLLYNAREAAGLTRAQLARKLKVRASVIEDVEENDYEGDALAILRQAGHVLGLRLEISLVPREAPTSPRRKSA